MEGCVPGPLEHRRLPSKRGNLGSCVLAPGLERSAVGPFWKLVYEATRGTLPSPPRVSGVDSDHLPAAAPDQEDPVESFGQDLQELHVWAPELRTQLGAPPAVPGRGRWVCGRGGPAAWPVAPTKPSAGLGRVQGRGHSGVSPLLQPARRGLRRPPPPAPHPGALAAAGQVPRGPTQAPSPGLVSKHKSCSL